MVGRIIPQSILFSYRNISESLSKAYGLPNESHLIHIYVINKYLYKI